MITQNTGQFVVRRLILSENSPLVLPPNWIKLASDIVVSDETDEPLIELWLAVPNVSSLDTQTSSNTAKTIYTASASYDDDFEGFSAADIEKDVQQALQEFDYGDEDEWYD